MKTNESHPVFVTPPQLPEGAVRWELNGKPMINPQDFGAIYGPVSDEQRVGEALQKAAAVRPAAPILLANTLWVDAWPIENIMVQAPE